MDLSHLGMERETDECVETSCVRVFYRFRALQEAPGGAMEADPLALRANRHRNANLGNYYNFKRRA